MSLSNASFGCFKPRTTIDSTDPVLQWPPAPETIRLHSGQVHLWAASLNEFADQAPSLGLLLSSDEQTRAEGFKFFEDRNRYVIRRGLLRQILGRYLGRAPSAIEFKQGAHGKPEIKRDYRSAPVFFNTSHSSGIAVFAFTPTCPIGIDVERLLEIPEIEAIASHFFTPRENQILMNLPVRFRLQAFYNCWTRKEAVLKATGEGIAENLPNVEITLAPQDEPGLVSLCGDAQAHRRWQLQTFSPDSDYVGCLAYRHPALKLTQWSVAQSGMQWR